MNQYQAAVFTGACNQVRTQPQFVPMGGQPEALNALWSRGQPAGIPLEPTDKIMGSLTMRRKLQDEVGTSRLYRRDPIGDLPGLGKFPACGRPPFVTQHQYAPVDLSLKDQPLLHTAADPIFGYKLYVEPFQHPVPQITGQQIYCNGFQNPVVV